MCCVWYDDWFSLYIRWLTFVTAVATRLQQHTESFMVNNEQSPSMMKVAAFDMEVCFVISLNICQSSSAPQSTWWVTQRMMGRWQLTPSSWTWPHVASSATMTCSVWPMCTTGSQGSVPATTPCPGPKLLPAALSLSRPARDTAVCQVRMLVCCVPNPTLL